MDNWPWAERVKFIRETGEMTYEEIGQLVGLSTSSVSDLANKYTKSPRGDAAVALDALYKRLQRRARANS